MANTVQSAKRARQNEQRRAQNLTARSKTKSAVRVAVDAIGAKKADPAQTQAAYIAAVKALSKAASRGAIPKRRAARKISRLTRLAQKQAPAALAASK